MRLCFPAILATVIATAAGCSPASPVEPVPTARVPVPLATFERPFGADSPWNTPVPDSPQLDSETKAMSARLLGGDHTIGLYSYGLPIYRADERTPRVHIRCGGADIEKETVPLPQNAAANMGTDHKLTVVDVVAGRSYELWGYDNANQTCAWGAVADLTGLGDGQVLAPTGAGVSQLGGVIRISDIRSGSLDHALAMWSSYTEAARFRYPAGKTDGRYRGPGAIPEGAWVQLDPSLRVNAIPGITRGEVMVARALQRYGAYLMDTGGSSVSVGFYAELPTSSDDPYRDVFGDRDWPQLIHIPWDRLRVLSAAETQRR